MAGELYYRIVLRTGGTVHYDLSSDIASMTIDEEAGKPDQLTIRMNDPYKLFSHALREGVEVEVELGWSTITSLCSAATFIESPAISAGTRFQG